MGQKTNPISNRIGITRGWDSNWCGGNYAEKIAEDYKIRKYLETRLAKASISKIVIERTLKLITVTIQAARPGVIIGKGGQEVDKLKDELSVVRKKHIDRMQSAHNANLQISLVYLNLLQESQQLLSNMRHQLRAAKKFMDD